MRHIEEKHCFYNLFSITSAPSLPALTLQWVLEFNVRPKNYVFRPKTIASYPSFDLSERFAVTSASGN